MKKWIKNNKKLLSIVVFIFAVLAILAFDIRLKTVTYNITDNRITEDITIALVTDLHSCRYGDGQKVLIDEINNQNPDIVLFGGDICDDEIPHFNTKLVLEGIANKYPCYYVAGNHEFWSGEVDAIKDMFRSYGVAVLEGSNKTINTQGQLLNICGIDDPDIEKFSAQTNIIKGQLANSDILSSSKLYTILLAHRPEYIKDYLQYGFDLILTGHAHGGQWRIPLILNGLYSPNQGWFPKYAGGLYEFDNSKMIVSRGLAKESTRAPRIFNRPELVIVNLSPI